MILTKRIYEPAQKEDGYRILVDRLWPRGISKEKVQLDLWMKEIAPSNELRKWFSHDPAKWEEFQKRYKQELAGKKEQVEQLKEICRKEKTVTLLYAAQTHEYNQTHVLLELVK